jgi:hypothetical protein
LNAIFSIRDNLESDSNVTEESDVQEEKHDSLKTSTDAGMVTNLRPVFENASDSIRSNLDLFSITTDLMDLFSETVFDEINLSGEGSHSRLTKK